MNSVRSRRRSEVSKTPSAVFDAKHSSVKSSPAPSNFHMLTRAPCRRAESSAWGVTRTSIRQAWRRGDGYAVSRHASEGTMPRADVTIESLHRRQAECLPGKFGLVVTRIAEGEVDAEVALQPWMLAPNGYLHAASVLLLADTAAGYASFAHLPDG